MPQKLAAAFRGRTRVAFDHTACISENAAMSKSARLLPWVAATLLLGACATPQSRIDRNPDTFQSLTSEQQALVKQGKVAIGFSEAAVKLALGEPQRVIQRTDEKGKSIVWRYVDFDNGAAGGAVGGFYGANYFPGFAGYGAFGRPIGFYNGFYGPGVTTIYTGSGAEHERLRVVFVDGKVTAIDESIK